MRPSDLLRNHTLAVLSCTAIASWLIAAEAFAWPAIDSAPASDLQEPQEAAAKPVAEVEETPAERGEAQESVGATPTPTGSPGATPTATPDIHDRVYERIHDLESNLRFEAWWDSGIRYQVGRSVLWEDQRERLQFGEKPMVDGRMGVKLGVDMAAFAEDKGLEDVDNGVQVRRFFFYTTGNFVLFRPVSYKVEFGLVNGFFLNAIWLQLEDVPYVGTLRVGQFDTPSSLQVQISSRDLELMEMAAAVQALAPGTRVGLQAKNHTPDQRFTWTYGWFADATSIDTGDASDSVARLIARFTGLPVYEHRPGVNRVVHLALSGSYTLASSSTIRYQSRPESFLAQHLVDTGDIEASDAFLVGTEMVWTHNQFSLQGETLHSFVATKDSGTRSFLGLYAQGSWFLTGEHRPYDRIGGLFVQVLPRRNFEPLRRKWGAWEAAARVSYLDLDDGPVEGGKMTIVMTGLNWYWNRYVRFQYNVGWSDVSGGVSDGQLYIFQTRMQLVF